MLPSSSFMTTKQCYLHINLQQFSNTLDKSGKPYYEKTRTENCVYVNK